MNKFPRRSILPQNTPVELAIRKAVEELEKVGADVKLTEALIHLNKAFDLVADYHDQHQDNKNISTEQM